MIQYQKETKVYNSRESEEFTWERSLVTSLLNTKDTCIYLLQKWKMVEMVALP